MPKEFQPTLEQAARLGWKIGYLEWKYRPIQFKFSEAWDKAQSFSKKFVLNSARRSTKSSWLLLTDFETCIREPGSYLAFVAPVEKALAEYIQQIGNELLADCPYDLRPQWMSQTCQYKFKNGSVISFAGSNSQSYNNLRGKKFKRASVDEAAYVDNLKELVEGVLIPAISDSNGFLRLSSTPPDIPDHPFQNYFNEAMQNGYGAHFTIYDAGYSNDWIETWAKEVGGKESTLFKREYLAQFVIDTEKLLIPEWRKDYVQDIPHDEFFNFYHKYDALDTGVRDFTVNLLSYYDFKRAALIVEDEVLLKGEGVRTDYLAEAIKAKEKALGYNKMFRRIGDNNNLIILQDLQGIHGLPFYPTTKDELFAMVNEVRLWVNSSRVLVHPRCKYLIGCLENGIWDKNKKEFARSVAYGHFDGIAALCYLVRHIDTNTNPIPAMFGLDVQTHHIPPMIDETPNYKNLREVLRLPTPQSTTDDWRFKQNGVRRKVRY